VLYEFNTISSVREISEYFRSRIFSRLFNARGNARKNWKQYYMCTQLRRIAFQRAVSISESRILRGTRKANMNCLFCNTVLHKMELRLIWSVVCRCVLYIYTSVHERIRINRYIHSHIQY
jgi:hypothetical protein